MKSLAGLLTPFHGALLHLVLIGVPARFGLLPSGLFQKSLGIPSPCSIFDHSEAGPNYECTPLEDFAIREFGYRYIVHYELAVVVCFIIKAVGKDTVKDLEYRRFNATLVMASVITMLVYSYLQVFAGGAGADAAAPIEQTLYARTIFYRLVAVLVSLAACSRGPDHRHSPTAAWSVPGFSVLIGAAVNIFIALASAQIIFNGGMEKYYVTGPGGTGEITPIVRTCFHIGVMHSVVNAVLMISLREFLSRDQLQAVCGYKILLHLFLPFFWFPEGSGFLHVNVLSIEMFRVFLLISYGCGFLLSGKMEPVSRIMKGEKSS